jgi:hypothetical protein
MSTNYNPINTTFTKDKDNGWIYYGWSDYNLYFMNLPQISVYDKDDNHSNQNYPSYAKGKKSYNLEKAGYDKCLGNIPVKIDGNNVFFPKAPKDISFDIRSDSDKKKVDASWAKNTLIDVPSSGIKSTDRDDYTYNCKRNNDPQRHQQEMTNE